MVQGTAALPKLYFQKVKHASGTLFFEGTNSTQPLEYKDMSPKNVGVAAKFRPS
jgi:hypothetical protein